MNRVSGRLVFSGRSWFSSVQTADSRLDRRALQSRVTAAAPCRHREARHVARILITIRPLIVLTFWLLAEPAFGIDLREWARNLHHHEDWTSVEFRDPFTGMFIASRAATEDLTRHATLTLTASPVEDCLARTVVVIELASPNPADVEKFSKVGIEIDDLRLLETDAKIVMPRDDHFVFIEIPGPYDTARLNDRLMMTISLGHVQIARFSLKGFASAWGEAQTLCQGFVLH